MKSSIVPAQVTTVEDKIAGNLTLQQIILLTMPIFLDFGLYIILPRNLHLSAYKLVIMALALLVSAMLAIRVKGKILLNWAITIGRYNLRPKFYVFNKNDDYLRDSINVIEEEPQANTAIEDDVAADKPMLPSISIAETAKLEGLLNNPAAKLQFKARRKGGLRVCITEVQQ